MWFIILDLKWSTLHKISTCIPGTNLVPGNEVAQEQGWAQLLKSSHAVNNYIVMSIFIILNEKSSE
jgi:hypothetical protein